MKLVVALGGNALGSTPKEQLIQVKQAAKAIVGLIKQGHQVVVGHGNGPQVGMINLAFDNDQTPDMPFAECGAMSQGYVGYHLQQAIRNQLIEDGIKKEVATIITEVEVDVSDKAFMNPSKPIGNFYTQDQANKISQEKRFTFVEDSGRGYRRVVPSPLPIDIVEKETINTLIKADAIVITVGGGGIPVIKTDQGYRGIDAVIDKDHACSLLARQLKADLLIILTAVDHVCINFGEENQQELTEINIATANKYLKDGEFGKGSMLPKIQACVNFIKTGNSALIASLENAQEALAGQNGTKIIP